jgi:hypothetical protein
MFHLDHCHPFGTSSAGSNAGQTCNALVDIWKAEIGEDGDVKRYEDDLPIIHFPGLVGHLGENGYIYRFDRLSIAAPIDPINTPWHGTKTGTRFDDWIVFIGLDWNFPESCVSLPTDKRLKHLARVQNMKAGIETHQSFLLLDLQELHGALCYICFVYCEGSSHLSVISNAMKGFQGNQFMTRHLSSSMLDTLVWWERMLLQPSFVRKLHPLGELRDFGIYVDASTSWGVGFVIGKRWYALQLREDWKRDGIDICWLEAVALELCFLFLEQLAFKDIYVLVRSDNKGAIGALTKGRSPNLDINLCARRSFAVKAGCGITTKIVYVPTADNIADAPSRGLPSHLVDKNRLKRGFHLPFDLRSVFIDVDGPPRTD